VLAVLPALVVPEYLASPAASQSRTVLREMHLTPRARVMPPRLGQSGCLCLRPSPEAGERGPVLPSLLVDAPRDQRPGWYGPTCFTTRKMRPCGCRACMRECCGIAYPRNRSTAYWRILWASSPK
jgi:hypothetical protein